MLMSDVATIEIVDNEFVVIETGIEGPPGQLDPADRVRVDAAIQAAAALATTTAQVTQMCDAAAGSAQAAAQAAGRITGMAVATGAPGSAATWDGQTLTVPRGDKGNLGPSAYQVALAAGFVGTEAAWLASLKGDPGPSWTVTVVTTQAAYDAAMPGPLELVVRV